MDFVGNTWNSVSFFSCSFYVIYFTSISTHLYRISMTLPWSESTSFMRLALAKTLIAALRWIRFGLVAFQWRSPLNWKYFSVRGWSLIFRADISAKTASTSHLRRKGWSLLILHLWLLIDNINTFCHNIYIYMQEATTNMHETIFRYLRLNVKSRQMFTVGLQH